GGAGQFSTGFSGTPSYTAVDYSRKRQQDPGGGGTALDSAFSHRSPESTTPTGEPYLRRQYTPAPTSTAVDITSDSTRYTSAASSGNYPTYLSARAEPV
ncbi:hypothetical protein AAVH_37926, partial [Aphelenchoides avenae]